MRKKIKNLFSHNIKIICQNGFKTCLFLVLAFTLASFAEDKVEFTSTVDRDKVYIGDKITLQVEAKNTKGYEFLFPEIPDLGDFSLSGFTPIKKGWPKKEDVGRTYVLGIYATGTHVIPPVSIEYRKKGAAEWQKTETSKVSIEVQSLLKGNEKDIKDVKGLVGLGPKINKKLLLLFVIFSLVFLMAWFLWRRYKNLRELEMMRKKPAHEIAYEELSELKEKHLPEKGLVKEYYVELSDITRHYLENRFLFRAPEMTTEEFLSSIREESKLDNDQKKLLKRFLSHCDMVKFAKYGPTPIEIIDSFKAAEELVDETKMEETEETGKTAGER